MHGREKLRSDGVDRDHLLGAVVAAPQPTGPGAMTLFGAWIAAKPDSAGDRC